MNYVYIYRTTCQILYSDAQWKYVIYQTLSKIFDVFFVSSTLQDFILILVVKNGKNGWKWLEPLKRLKNVKNG